MGTSPSKNLITPTGFTPVLTTYVPASPNLVSSSRMTLIVSPVFLNPRILVPRFVLVHYFDSAQAPVDHVIRDTPVPKASMS